jgi:hypothetical protein
MMGLADGFGQAVFRRASQDDIDGFLQTHPVPDRDEHGFDPRASAQYHPNQFVAIHERLALAAFFPNRLIFSYQAGFAYANGGQVAH